MSGLKEKAVPELEDRIDPWEKGGLWADSVIDSMVSLRKWVENAVADCQQKGKIRLTEIKEELKDEDVSVKDRALRWLCSWAE